MEPSRLEEVLTRLEREPTLPPEPTLATDISESELFPLEFEPQTVLRRATTASPESPQAEEEMEEVVPEEMSNREQEVGLSRCATTIRTITGMTALSTSSIEPTEYVSMEQLQDE
jgi:hypothetical protein